MSAPDLYPEMDEQLDAIGDPEAAESSGMFVIDSLDKANWAVRKIAVYAARVADATEFARRERERLDLWLEGEREQAERSTAFLAGLLRRFHESLLAEDPKRKTVRLPAGELKARKAQDQWEIDESEFVEWAKVADQRLIREVVSVNRPAVKKHLRIADFGDEDEGWRRVIETEGGELVPGVIVYVAADDDLTFSVKPREEER